MAYRKDLERTAAAMMKIKNPVTPLPGDFQNLSEAKKISERKFKENLEKLKKVKFSKLIMILDIIKI